MSATSNFQLKDQINKDLILRLSADLSLHYPAFRCNAFEDAVFKELDSLELKARISLVATTLCNFLPADFRSAIEILKKVGPAYQNMPALIFPEFVRIYGQEEWEISMEALAAFTSLCSSEFAVRPFIVHDTPGMMAQMSIWADSPDHHLRRLASEGCRPRLPWGTALKSFQKDPSPILPILEKLKDDPSDYVRKSVANNLNDISKDHPELVLVIAKSWLGKSTRTDRLLKHALRTLLKSGHKEAMQLFGFADPEHIQIKDFRLSKKIIAIGESLDFFLDLVVREKGTWKLRLEYGVYYLKSNGSHSKKVFQLSEKLFQGFQSYKFTKTQHFKNLTTRKHYRGIHHISIIINGEEYDTRSFKLIHGD